MSQIPTLRTQRDAGCDGCHQRSVENWLFSWALVPLPPEMSRATNLPCFSQLVAPRGTNMSNRAAGIRQPV